MATKRSKDAATGFGLSEISGLPLSPSDAAAPGVRRSGARAVAGILDTALLVLVGLVALAIVWWLVASVISTVLFFVKLAALAVVLALLVRTWLWVRKRSR